MRHLWSGWLEASAYQIERKIDVGYKWQLYGRPMLMALALSALSLVSGLALPQRASGSASTPTQLTPRAYLPFVMRQEEPPVPDLAIYDKYGTLQDWDWLVTRFGDVTLDRGTGAASVGELREVEGTSTLVLWLFNANGEPIVGQEVIFYWPDAPDLESYQEACGLTQGVMGQTKENGEVGFGMGPGAHYVPEEGEVGPHQVWIVRAGTDCLRGLGMILDNHIHLDSVWVLP